MCDYDDGEYPSVYRESKPAARKTYRCEECRCRIVPGERHLYAFGVWEGEAMAHRICLDCERVIHAWREVSIKVCNQAPSFNFGEAGAVFATFVAEHLKMIAMLGAQVTS